MAGIIEQGTGLGGAAEAVGNLRMRKDGPSEVSAKGPSTTPFHAPLQAGPLGGFRICEDFPLAAGGTLPAPWGKQDTSAAGAPVTDYVDDADGGEYVLALAADNEVETLTLYHADQLLFDITKKPFFHARVKLAPDVTGAAGNLAAGDKIVIGLAAARNATLDSNTVHAWFRLEGANKNILWETDDGTTDDDDNDTGVDWVADTYLLLSIDASNLSAVRFFVNGVCVGVGAMAAATGNLQPYIELQKAAAANFDHKLTVDFIDVGCNR